MAIARWSFSDFGKFFFYHFLRLAAQCREFVELRVDFFVERAYVPMLQTAHLNVESAFQFIFNTHQ